jgi:1-acyl-sn-glycerol-3-phosphate acyltransferase
MLTKVRNHLVGSATLLLFMANTALWGTFFFPVALAKLSLPFKAARRFFNRTLHGIAHLWICGNNTGIRLTRRIEWHAKGTDDLNNKKWYLVISNHQSWTDIVVLQKVFYKKIPFIKFFLKKELIWVPVLGLAWWALEFPFMKRYKSSFLEKHPHLRGKDIEITKKACAKFRELPVSIMNFVEGTRFSELKHRIQESPYRNLLRSKSGGIGFVFSTIGEHLTSILNVTIAYPGGPYTFWDFLCGMVKKVLVDVEELPVTEHLIGDYVNDPHYRERFQQWLNALWKEKDLKIEQMLRDLHAPKLAPAPANER